MIAYYLNLADRKDREAAFHKNNGSLFDCRRCPAIPGSPQFTARARLSGLLAKSAKLYADPCVACAAGIKKMWERVRDRDEIALCCADDAIFNKEAPQHLTRMLAYLPEDWDIIELAPSLTNFTQFEVIPGWLEVRLQWSQPL